MSLSLKNNIKRVALIGPESTGKSSLCRQMAEHFKTTWVDEYAREYIAGLNRSYTKEDIIHCAEKQMETEDQALLSANNFFFADTELIVCKVWLLDVFGGCPQWIEDKIEERKYDLYLLTHFDIPFVSDPVRENPHRREFFFNWYKRELETRNFAYEIISGDGQERFGNALKSISKLFNG